MQCKPDLGPEVPGATCPKCGEQLDGATSAAADGALPSPEDFAVCAYCGVYLRFVEREGALRLQWIPPAEFAELPQPVRDTLRRAKAAAALLRHRRGERQFADVMIIGKPRGRKELN